MTRSIRAEQDREYAESLAIDQAKESMEVGYILREFGTSPIFLSCIHCLFILMDYMYFSL